MSYPRPPYLRARRGGDKMLMFRMCAAAIATVSGIAYLFFHEYVTAWKEHRGQPNVGIDHRGLVGLTFCFLLTLIFISPEIKDFIKSVVEGIRAWRRREPDA